MKNAILTTTGMILFVWSILFVVGLGIGGLDGLGEARQSKPINACYGPPTRWSYIIPGIRLGCWLSEKIDATQRSGEGEA